MDWMGYVVAVAVGLIIGGAFAMALARGSSQRLESRAQEDQQRLSAEMESVRQQVEQARIEVNEKNQELARATERLAQLDEARAKAAELQESLGQAERENERLKADVAAQQKKNDEQRLLLEETEKRMLEAFKNLGNQTFQEQLALVTKKADELAAHYKQLSEEDLDKRQQNIRHLVDPIKQTLEKYETELKQMEVKREGAYESIKAQIDQTVDLNRRLQEETRKLSGALRDRSTRGRWGEIQLQRIVELAGMTEHVDFMTQTSSSSDEGRRRPDAVVSLPQQQSVAIDAKVPLDAYLAAQEATDDTERLSHLRTHAARMKSTVKELASKNYQSSIQGNVDYVIMFVPLESAISDAFSVEPELYEDALGQKVLITSGATLLPLLQAFAYGWRQVAMAENAERISETARELYERIGVFLGHYQRVGASLSRAVTSYNQSVGSLERNVTTSLDRLVDLKVASALPEGGQPQPLAENIRPINKPETRSLIKEDELPAGQLELDGAQES